MIENDYKKQLSGILDTTEGRIFLYWKGRVALYALLKAMGVGKGDEVILPAYTCVVVPNALIYLSATPIYVDIDSDTYNANYEAIVRAITPRTKVILCQNTFGLSSSIEKVCELAKSHHLFTIEDCTHGFGGLYNNKPNGSYCDAAFFSTQWNKPFSTGIGGFSLVNNPDLVEPLNVINQSLETPSVKDRLSLKALYLVKKRLLVGFTYWTFVNVYRFLSQHNLVLGSSSGEEITSIKQPPHYFKAATNVQFKEGLKNILYLTNLLIIRKNNATIYTNYLIKNGKNHVPSVLFENHSFLKYPLLVHNREEVLKLAEKNRIELGEWLNSPLHPVQEDLERWELHPQHFPIADFMGKHMINLPTDTHTPEKVLAFLETIHASILDAGS